AAARHRGGHAQRPRALGRDRCPQPHSEPRTTGADGDYPDATRRRSRGAAVFAAVGPACSVFNSLTSTLLPRALRARPSRDRERAVAPAPLLTVAARSSSVSAKRKRGGCIPPVVRYNR